MNAVSFRHLDILRTVVRTRTVSAAARLLGITQPAVSRQLRALEEQLGLRLFERDRKRLWPTPEAEQVLREAECVFAGLENITQLAADLRNARTGRLLVAAIPTLSVDPLAAVVAAFARGHPEAQIAVKVLPAQQVLDRVLKQQVDLGLVYGPLNDRGLETEPLGPSREVAVFLPPGHALARRRDALRPRDLQSERLISVARLSPLGLRIDEAFVEDGSPRRSIIEVSHAIAALAMVEAGAGVAVIDRAGSPERLFRRCVVRSFEPRIVTQPVVAMARFRVRSRLAETFREELCTPRVREEAGPGRAR